MTEDTAKKTRETAIGVLYNLRTLNELVQREAHGLEGAEVSLEPALLIARLCTIIDDEIDRCIATIEPTAL